MNRPVPIRNATSPAGVPGLVVQLDVTVSVSTVLLAITRTSRGISGVDVMVGMAKRCSRIVTLRPACALTVQPGDGDTVTVAAPLLATR